ncbi:hypothetical protein R6Q57_010201 [Mikania cordata]
MNLSGLAYFKLVLQCILAELSPSLVCLFGALWLILAIYQEKRTEPVVKMMEHKWRPVSIGQGSLTSLTSKRHKAGLSISPKERNEKLGEKIAALQQLVSPYGKTDTASVLLEAIEYIHFLHDQVKALSAPYLLSNPTAQSQVNYGLLARGVQKFRFFFQNPFGSVFSVLGIRFSLVLVLMFYLGLKFLSLEKKLPKILYFDKIFRLHYY